jgi:hypothetical protein
MTGMVAALAAVSLAAFAVVHFALLVALLRQTPRYRALVALVVPPLAPYWGWQVGAKRRVNVWALSLVLYATGVAVLRR